MSRKLMAVFLSSALVFGSVSTSAWSATDTSNATQVVQTTDGAKNSSPLPAGSAAGIKEAQGGFENSPLLGLGLVVGIVLIAWLLIDNNSDDDSSSGTN